MYSDALIFQADAGNIGGKNLDWELFYTSKYLKCIFGNNFFWKKIVLNGPLKARGL